MKRITFINICGLKLVQSFVNTCERSGTNIQRDTETQGRCNLWTPPAKVPVECNSAGALGEPFGLIPSKFKIVLTLFNGSSQRAQYSIFCTPVTVSLLVYSTSPALQFSPHKQAVGTQ